MSFNFAEYVTSIIGLNMIDVRFASLTKEFIILCRQVIQSSILFKYRLSLEIAIYTRQSNYLIIARYLYLFYPFYLQLYD